MKKQLAPVLLAIAVIATAALLVLHEFDKHDAQTASVESLN